MRLSLLNPLRPDSPPGVGWRGRATENGEHLPLAPTVRSPTFAPKNDEDLRQPLWRRREPLWIPSHCTENARKRSKIALTRKSIGDHQASARLSLRMTSRNRCSISAGTAMTNPNSWAMASSSGLHSGGMTNVGGNACVARSANTRRAAAAVAA